MAEMAVSASMGVMQPLLDKLATLMSDEYKKLKGVRKQASSLRDELSTINALLMTLASIDDELDPLTKEWRNNVRDMSYDMEDCIDDFMHHLGSAEPGFFKNIARRLKTVRARHQIANQMDELKARAIEVNARRMRYKLNDTCKSSTSAHVTVDPRISALYKDASSLVGINGPREELIKWLTDDTNQQLVVVSIVGFGGLGKTTLAKQVYDKIGEQYNCKAFVSISQRPDMRRLLNNIGSKLGIGVSSQACEVEDIIAEIRGNLKLKRYFVVVDDLWDQASWNIIRCCFPENDYGSRVIVTTRVEDVATSTCRNHRHIYRMKPLNDKDSRRLFFSRIFGSADGCPSHVLAEILERCGGLPLAIITIASLARPERLWKEWKNIRNSLDSQFGTNPTLDGMRQILDLSYKSLPHHLRTCLLYLGIYPEDHEVKKDDLVRRWIAEGFVSNSHGQDLEDLGESYFNELVNRSLVQPVTNEEYGMVISCRVHDMMLDLILRRCKEDNFITVVNCIEDVARPDGDRKVRRMSVLSSKSNSAGDGATLVTSEAETIRARMSQVRSFALFGEYAYRLPTMAFRHLRLLHLRLWRLKRNEKVNVTAIGQMFQLRYLKIDADLLDVELPTKIGGLVYLDTLDLSGTYLASIPEDIASLPCLRNLFAQKGAGTPQCICDIKSLRALHGVRMVDIGAKGFDELTNLRELSVRAYCDSVIPTAWTDVLGSAVRKLRNLRHFVVHSSQPMEDGGQLGTLSDPPPHLEVLELPSSWRFPRVPRWINGDDLQSLRVLQLSLAKTSGSDVRLLGELPALFCLKLHVLRSPSIMVSAWSFPCLEYLVGGSFLGFLPGAMPKLRSLSLRFCEGEWSGATPIGMEHLLSLQKIHVSMEYSYFGNADDRADRAFSNAAQAHPSRPDCNVSYYTTW